MAEWSSPVQVETTPFAAAAASPNRLYGEQTANTSAAAPRQLLARDQRANAERKAPHERRTDTQLLGCSGSAWGTDRSEVQLGSSMGVGCQRAQGLRFVQAAVDVELTHAAFSMLEDVTMIHPASQLAKTG